MRELTAVQRCTAVQICINLNRFSKRIMFAENDTKMTREQLSQVATVDDLLQLKLSIKEEIDLVTNYLKALRNDLEQAGNVKPEKLHFTPKEFAARLGIGARAVFNWCHNGTIRASQPNGHGCTWMIPVSELDRMVEEGYENRQARR